MLVVALLVASACSSSSATVEPVSAPSTAAPPEQPTEPTSLAPTVAGSTFDLSSVIGTDVVMWFWAPW